MFYTAKIQNWKQFTTDFLKIDHETTLCFTLQRYKIESNSQHYLGIPTNVASCVLHCKDTKLKAIHNYSSRLADRPRVVFYTAKIQNWKQFTTQNYNTMMWRMLCFTLQRYKIESNSQRDNFNKYRRESCVLHCKDTKLKAIHNVWGQGCSVGQVVFYTAKIQNWKQFTTHSNNCACYLQLCFTLQRYKIESNSQLAVDVLSAAISCVLHCKDTKLKAIHNVLIFLSIM